MSRYLLYDAGCSTCTGLARSVERETGSWLSARSLRDPDMQKYLQSAKSNWNWEPTLLVINGANVKVYTGKSMAVYMLLGLGVRKSLRITHLVRQATQGNHPQIQGVDRRAILVRAASIVGGTTLAGLFGVGKVAASPMLREDAADWQLMKPHEVAQYSSLILDSNEGQQCEAFLSSQGFQPTPSLSAGTIITYMDEQSFSLEIGYRLNDTTQGRIVGAGRSGSIERVYDTPQKLDRVVR